MSGFRAVALYGLTVPPGEDPVPAFGYESYPATFKLTMAALDPFAKAEENETTQETKFTGATLKVIRIPNDETDDEDEDDDDEMDLLGGLGEDDEDESDEDEEEDEDVTGGPSDLAKSAKARKIAALRDALAEAEDMEVDASPKLSAKAKGKAKAPVLDAEELEEDDDDEEDSDEGDVDEIAGPEEFVLCTLDPSKNYQQTLDITINEYETVYFQVSGTHAVHLTGNILVPDEGDDYDEDDSSASDDEYDLSPDEDELDIPDDEDESDELDAISDPRITELADDEVKAPKLVPAKKGKNKRSAPDSTDTSMVDDVPAPAAVPLDDLLAKSLKAEPASAATNGEAKLSKKQKKKLKSNAGTAVDAPAAAATKEDVGEAVKASPKPDKKVQFSKPIIQGPTPSTSSPDAAKATGKVNGEAAGKGAAGPRTVQGVIIDDKKPGSGPAAKKGNKVSMRYIGKLFDTKQQFDSNKKGKPFTFTLGAGEVIKGWDVGVAGMQVGGERRITIPANLAYGSKGQPGIPANSKLVFDLKVLEIK